MLPVTSRTHNVAHITIRDHLGTHDAGEVHVHKSRSCDNCAHDGTRDAEWVADRGVEQLGRCMSACTAADSEDALNRWCDGHQTDSEWSANTHRADRPALIAVHGGAL